MADLDGITVVSLEQAVAAPYASCKLADAGARVIKVERPEGDFARGYDTLVNGDSAYFVWLNRGKQSICLDLKVEADRALMTNMLSSADIFIQNLIPGAVERLGFAPQALRAQNSRLITCSISGYGAEGPYRDHKAYDLLIQAETGLSAITGIGEEPARVGVSVCDIAAGMTAHQAILQALYVRERTGVGRALNISLFHATADWMNVPYLQTRYGGKPPSRQGLSHPTIAPYGVFTCADGRKLLISIQNEREWQRLCIEALDRPDLAANTAYASNTGRIADRPRLDAEVAKSFAETPSDVMAARLEKSRIAYGRQSEIADLATHPQTRLIRVATENGTVELLSPDAVAIPPPQTYEAVPTKDQHGDILRQEFTT